MLTNPRRLLRSAWLTFCLAVATCAEPVAEAIHPDPEAVAAADLAYAAAWLANDPEAVMATLVDRPVIVPSGREALVGPAAVRAFWFPPGSPPTTVTRYDIEQADVVTSGVLGVVRGTFRLAFDYDGASYESGGTYVTVLRRGENGGWRIALRSWCDHPD